MNTIPLDNDEREKILAYEGNIAIVASAGSGKTTIMTKKINKVLASIKTHKTVVAITFTRKATEEIRRKATEMSKDRNFIAMTNDSFADLEIIRPFISDLIGEGIEFKNSYDKKDCFKKFDQGLEKLQSGILGTYMDSKKKFKYELALKILNKSVAAREYIKSKYEMIFIDEYQDSDADMHELFMYIANELKIKLFLVGDPKQSIYEWRGADKRIFEKLPESFEVVKLFHNFRCPQAISQYANILHDPKVLDNIPIIRCNEIIIGSGDPKISTVINSNILDLSKEITIIVRTNKEGEDFKEHLKKELNLDFEFIPKTPLDDLASTNVSYLRMIVKYIVDKKFNIFDFINSMSINVPNKDAEKLSKILSQVDEFAEDGAYQKLVNISNEIFGVELNSGEIDALRRTLKNKKVANSFIDTEAKYRIMTIYGAKGLEFDQVVGYAKDYTKDIVKSWKTHYVFVTRAKEKLVIIDNESNEYRSIINKCIKYNGKDPGMFYQSLSF